MRNPKQFTYLFHSSFNLILCSLFHLEGIRYVLGYRHMRVEGVVLEDHRYVSLLWRETAHTVVVYHDVPLIRNLQSRDATQSRRFAATRGANDDDERAG